MLFDFARQVGYQKVRLDLANEERQPQALKLYKRLGFYSIERYNDSPCNIFMEKSLESNQSANHVHQTGRSQGSPYCR